MKIDRRQFAAGALAAPLFPFAARAQDAAAFTILEARPGEAQLRGASESGTPILGYNGQYPGPLPRAKKGEEVRLRLVNKLQQPTSLHIRGLRGANAMEGISPLTQQAVAPGASQEIRFTPQESGTLFFHPHATPFAAEQAGRGLGGALIVEEDKPPEVDHDLLFAFADWRLDAKGALGDNLILPADSAGAGRRGPLVTINGAPAPLLHEARPNARIRLRVINMAMAQIAALSFEGVKPMIIAIDSQPCSAFEPVNRTFPIAPGARFDILFDMPEAEKQQAKIVMRRWPLAGETMQPQEIAAFTAKGEARKPLPPIASLPDNPALPAMIPMQNARRHDFTIAPVKAAKPDPRRLWSLGAVPDLASPKPLFSVKRGTALSLGFVNKSDVPHVMRVHGHVMRQLHLLDDGWEPYWRDSVVVPENRTVRVTLLADNPGRWRIGSGILAHGESGLSSWFEVT